MDFVERAFGVWIDGGDGSLEIFLITGVIIVAGALRFRRHVFRCVAALRGRLHIMPDMKSSLAARAAFASMSHSKAGPF